SELMRRLRGQGGAPLQPEPVLLVAEEQTAGRGRLGRAWQSRRGDSLTFSLSLPLQPVDWSGLSLVVGISVAESLDPRTTGQTGPSRIRLKWPNDVWLSGPDGDRKLGGILVETAGGTGSGTPRQVVIGIGINICRPESAAAADPNAVAAAVPPGALRDVWPDATAAGALVQIIAPLVQALQAFEQSGFAPFQARFAARDVLAGREVRLSDGLHGTAHGVGNNGALLVHTASGMTPVTSSEVSVRPVVAGGAGQRPQEDTTC
ncbi:MAG: biotin--[acetyl-CoA-carboxylase] ligase, partial [Comamonadaceae bacterium]